MQTEPWWMSAKLYELYIDKFAVNLEGLTAHLDYFSKLGVTALHLLPHYPSPMVDDGYDVADYRGVRPELGTLDDFAEFLRGCHARGLRVIIDFVLNHTSQEHPWFVEARSSKDNPKRDWYLWREIEYGFEGSTNAFPDLKPNNWIYNEATQDYYFATFYAEQPDLNWDNPEVFEAMLANMEFWAAMGVDGFRLDAAPYLIKRENSSSKGLSETHEVIKKIRARIESRYPDVVLLAEAHQSVALTKQYFGKGDECHLAYHFPLMEQLWVATMLGEEDGLAAVEEQSQPLPPRCQWVTFLRNHDEISLSTLPQTERSMLVAALDPEQHYLFKKAGATSVRLATALRGEHQKIVQMLSRLYTLPGSPVMYYGDELGMENLPLESNFVDTRRYVRGTFDWQEAEKQMANPGSLWSATQGIVHGKVPAADAGTAAPPAQGAPKTETSG